MKLFSRVLLPFIMICTSLCAEESKSPKKFSSFDIEVEKNFLLVPISAKAPYRDFEILDEASNPIGKYNAKLDSTIGDWNAEINVSKYKGRKIKFSYEDDGKGKPSIKQVDSVPSLDFARDTGRPKYHFTPKYGWLNDPNGLIFFGGKWHMFHQFNPFSMHWRAPMHWGHAVSRNLLHWEYEPIAVYPAMNKDGVWDQAFSGTAYYDKDNRSKLFSSNGGVIFAYTSTGRGECLMYSDDMKTFKEFSGNPIIKAPGRDPRIFFNEDSNKWTLIRYEEEKKDDKVRKFFAIYISDDLKKWEKTDELDGYYECPEMFKIPVTGAVDTPKWVIWEANGNYVVGDFDGRKFKQISKERQRLFYGDAYASQVWQNDPKGRILATAWIKQNPDLLCFINQKFSQCMSMPWELKLVRMRDGQYQLRALVPQEVNDRKGNPRDALGGTDMEFSGNIFELPEARGNNFVLEGVADIGLASAFRFEVGSSNMRYIPESNSYIVAHVHDIKYNQKAQADLIKDIIMWRAFVDTYSTEIQINDGEAVIFMGDSYLHPDQPIRVGGVGPVRVRYMFRMPMLRYTVKERGSIAERRINMLLKPKKSDDAKSGGAVEKEDAANQPQKAESSGGNQ